jgi:hypothetical protein
LIHELIPLREPSGDFLVVHSKTEDWQILV